MFNMWKISRDFKIFHLISKISSNFKGFQKSSDDFQGYQGIF